MLLYVLQSEGSSPGRRGFNMAVAADGSFNGTIGGGIMEYKLVEKAKAMLAGGISETSLMWQHHDKKSSEQSGMICSGSQLNAFIPLTIHQLPVIEAITNSERDGTKQIIQLSPAGISILQETNTTPLPLLQYQSSSDWLYQELVNNQPIIHIIGGGHVGLAFAVKLPASAGQAAAIFPLFQVDAVFSEFLNGGHNQPSIAGSTSRKSSA